MRKTKIICTIGPASWDRETLKKMMLAGMNGARFNFSHGSWETLLDKVNLVKELRKELNLPVAIILDTKGPEIRLGSIDGKVELKEGDKFTLTNDDILGNNKRVSVSYKNLRNEVKPGDKILLDDGLITMVVDEITAGEITCTIINGGTIISNRSVNVPDVNLNLPSLTEKDIKDIGGAVEHGVEYISASFVRRKEDVLAIKEILDKHHSNIKIISKIENREGLENLDEILEISDGIMVARGDLGVEIPFSEVPIVQKDMIKKTYTCGKLVVTATQMMESMIKSPNPTRAEVSDVANAIFDGTGAIMLSGETAMGSYPVQCIEKMASIACDVEASIDYLKRFKNREIPLDNFEFIINHSLLTTLQYIDVKAIFCYTRTSDTPRIVASMQPKCPIFTSTSDYQVYNQLSLIWGLVPKYMEKEVEPKVMIMDDVTERKQEGLLNEDDIILIAGGKYIIGDEKEMNKSIGGIYRV